MVVRVDKAGHDRFAGDVEDLRTLRNRDGATRADCNDTAVFHNDIRVLDDLLSLHRERASTTKYGDTLGQVTRCIQRDTNFCRLVTWWCFLGRVRLRDRIGARNAVLDRLCRVGA